MTVDLADVADVLHPHLPKPRQKPGRWNRPPPPKPTKRAALQYRAYGWIVEVDGITHRAPARFGESDVDAVCRWWNEGGAS